MMNEEQIEAVATRLVEIGQKLPMLLDRLYPEAADRLAAGLNVEPKVGLNVEPKVGRIRWGGACLLVALACRKWTGGRLAVLMLEKIGSGRHFFAVGTLPGVAGETVGVVIDGAGCSVDEWPLPASAGTRFQPVSQKLARLYRHPDARRRLAFIAWLAGELEAEFGNGAEVLAPLPILPVDGFELLSAYF